MTGLTARRTLALSASRQCGRGDDARVFLPAARGEVALHR